MDESALKLAPASIRHWVNADRALDLDMMRQQLSPDVVLISPLTDGFDFRGRHEVMAVFSSAFALMQNIEIKRVTGTGTDWVLHGTQTMHGGPLEEIQWLHVNADGLIDHITLFIRPVPAVLGMLGSIAPGLQREGVLPQRAVVASAPVKLLAAALRLIERVVMPRIGPRR